jgi:hypothetical protein
MKPFYKEYPQGTVAASVEQDAHDLAPNLRQGDVDELRYYNNGKALDVLLASYKNAKLSLTLKDTNGKTAAMFGVGWTQNPRVGRIWLLSSDYIYEIGKPFLRECPKIIGIFMQGHDLLFNHVYDDNLPSIRWLQWLGFEATQRFPEVGEEKQPFTEFCLFSSSSVRDLYVNRDWHEFIQCIR